MAVVACEGNHITWNDTVVQLDALSQAVYLEK